MAGTGDEHTDTRGKTSARALCESLAEGLKEQQVRPEYSEGRGI